MGDEIDKWVGILRRGPLAPSLAPKFDSLHLGAYELIFSRCDGRVDDAIPVDTAYRLVVYYILASGSAARLRDTAFFRVFDVVNFIGSHAELFYLNGNVGVLIELFRKRERCSGNELISHHSAEHSTGDILRGYVSTIVELSPRLIIDDLILDSLDPEKGVAGKMAGPMHLFESPDATLRWIHLIVSFKHLRRTVLRLIFDRVVYFDACERPHRFQILREIIGAYSQTDRLIRNGTTRKHISAASDILATLTNSLAANSRPEVAQVEEKVRGLSLECSDNIKLPPLTSQGDIELLARDITGYMGTLERSIQPVVDDPRKHGSLAELHQYYVDSQDIHEDSVFVLGNLVWEEIIFYLLDPSRCGDDVIRAIVELLAAIIRETGDFFRKRIVDNRACLSGLRIDACALADAIVCNFVRVDGICSDLARLAERCRHTEVSARIRRRLAEHNPDLFQQHLGKP